MYKTQLRYCVFPSACEIALWIVEIQDITEDCKEIHRLIKIRKQMGQKKAVWLEITYSLRNNTSVKSFILFSQY